MFIKSTTNKQTNKQTPQQTDKQKNTETNKRFHLNNCTLLDRSFKIFDLTKPETKEKNAYHKLQPLETGRYQ